MRSGKKYELFYLFSWLTLELLNYYQFVFEFKLNCRFSNFSLNMRPRLLSREYPCFYRISFKFQLSIKKKTVKTKQNKTKKG